MSDRSTSVGGPVGQWLQAHQPRLAAMAVRGFAALVWTPRQRDSGDLSLPASPRFQSSFFVRTSKGVLLITAGHCLAPIMTAVTAGDLGELEFAAIAGGGEDAAIVPWPPGSYQALWSASDTHRVDFGAVTIPNEVLPALGAAGFASYSREMWADPVPTADLYFALGIPAESLEHELETRADGARRVSVMFQCNHMWMRDLRWEKDPPVPSNDRAVPFMRLSLISNRYRAPDDRYLLDLGGVSGGPVFALETASGRFSLIGALIGRDKANGDVIAVPMAHYLSQAEQWSRNNLWSPRPVHRLVRRPDGLAPHSSVNDQP